MTIAMAGKLLLIGLLGSLTIANPVTAPDWFLAKRAALSDCLAAAKIETSLPSTASWAKDTQPWNSRIAPVPAAVVFPTDEKQVSAAIKCAASAKTKVTTLGGNRSFASMGFGRNDGTMVINLVHMKVLTFNEGDQTFTYGGPVTISEAAKFVWNNHKRALMHGRCPDVGMTGIAFGGGFGTLSRLHGTVLDDIVAVRAVLANGEIVDASAKENPDLFWAVRGAASSVASVLTVTIQTFEPPSTRVVSYTIGFPKELGDISLEQNAASLVGLQDWAQGKDNVDNLSIRYKISTNGSLSGFFYGSTEEFNKVAQTLLAHLPKMAVLSQQELDFWISENYTTPGLAEGTNTERRYFYITSVTVPSSHPLTLETAKTLLQSTAFAPKPAEGVASGLIDIWGGALAKTIKPDTSAWRHDNNLLLVRWDLRGKLSTDTFSDATMKTLRENFYKFVDAYEKDGGVLGGFPNYRDAEWSVAQMAKYLFGSNWSRLLKVKQKLDPEGVFDSDPQSVSVKAIPGSYR
ncbi:berberine-like protein [Teratosphaeria destructans]|uniref:Berberine-like protein n=1 Tax=Teratosphaeria destructans TaxID=418781 RepID=A0A9W7W5W4_9PEZI|nr:berberine-like protein [Teratosphaeria destructans]